jgi:tetratricopeptide (TPR) repeat protein
MTVRRALAATLCIAVLASPRSASPALPEFVTSAEWTRLETAHFSVITDAGPGVGADVARKLERFSQALGQLNPGLRATSALPTVVYVFRDQSELESYRPAESENVLAFFTPAEERNLLVLNGSPEGTARSEVVFHEFVHCYLTANYATVPMWLNEGLAEYYSTCRLTRGAAEFGKPNMPIVEWMKGRPTITMEIMFAMRADAPAYQRDNGLRNQFYAQSFVLTHYLQSPSSGKAERFDRFLARLHDGGPPQSAFRAVFPDSEWAPMIAGLDEYLGRIDFEKTRTVNLNAAAAGDPKSSALKPAEALTLLGELQLHLGAGRAAVAGEHFAAALALDPGFSPAHAGLGIVADLGGRPGLAEEHYARALSASPADPRVLNQTARGTMARLVQRMKAGAPAETLEAIARLARERYHSSLRADPDNLEALGGYGRAVAIAGDPPDSATVRGLERAVAALPGRADLAAALATLQDRQAGLAATAEPSSRPAASDAAAEDAKSDPAAMQLLNDGADLATALRFEEARAKFAQARDRAASEEVRSRADEYVKRVDAEIRLRSASDLARSNRLKEAEAALTAADAAWPDESYKTRAGKMLADVRGRLAIQSGLASVKAGKLAEARASFQRVLSMDVTDSMKDYARARIKELEAATAAGH